MFPTCYFQYHAVLIEGWQQQQLLRRGRVEGHLELRQEWTFRKMIKRWIEKLDYYD
jgi:hypothetical protein